VLTRYLASINQNEKEIVLGGNRTVTIPELGTYTCSDIFMQVYGPGVNFNTCLDFQRYGYTCCPNTFPSCAPCRYADEMSTSTEDCK